MMRGEQTISIPKKGREERLRPMTEPRLYKIAHGLVLGFDIFKSRKRL
jgi:hypothetical protein